MQKDWKKKVWKKKKNEMNILKTFVRYIIGDKTFCQKIIFHCLLTLQLEWRENINLNLGSRSFFQIWMTKKFNLNLYSDSIFEKSRAKKNVPLSEVNIPWCSKKSQSKSPKIGRRRQILILRRYFFKNIRTRGSRGMYFYLKWTLQCKKQARIKKQLRKNQTKLT